MGTSIAASPTFDREPPLLQRRSDLLDNASTERLLVHLRSSGDSPDRAALPSPGRPMMAP